MAIPSHIAHDLGNLDSSLKEMKNLCAVAELVPPIKGEANALKAGIETVQPPVHETKLSMDELAEAVEPAREAVKSAISQIKQLNNIEKVIHNIESHISKIEKVLDGVNLIDHKLSVVIKPMLKLKRLLRKKFHIKFSYPDPKNILLTATP